MNFRNFFDDLNLNRRDIPYLLIVLLISAVLTVKFINHSFTINTNSDVIAYLVNALRFAGMADNISDAHNMYSTPVVCILTSLLFRIGIVDKFAIFFVSGVFAILGNIGLYILLKQRFDEFLSMFGCFLYASFCVMLRFWGTGGIDIPVCAVSIFAVLFMILAVDKNPRYYILASVFLVGAIFTKYVAFILIPLFLLYYLSKNDFFDTVELALTDRDEFILKSKEFIKSREFKYIVISVILFAVLFAGFCGIIMHYHGGLTFITQTKDSVGGFEGGQYLSENNYEANKLWYFENFNHVMYHDAVKSFDFSWIVILAFIAGMILNIKNLWPIEFIKSHKIKSFDKIIKVLAAIMFIMTVIGFKISYIVSAATLMVGLVCLLSILNKSDMDRDRYSLTILFFAWFAVYMIFFSFLNIKEIRYLIIIVPAVIYFICWALEGIFNNTKYKKALKIILIIIMLLLMIHALTFTFHTKHDARDNADIEGAYDYIIKVEPDYKDKVLHSDYSYHARYGKWYLKTDVFSVKHKNVPTLDYKKTEFFISNHTVEFKNLTEVYNQGDVHLYQRIH